MALSDKDIVITPNKGQTTDPKIEFKGADASLTAQTITLNVYPTDNGTVSFEGSAGQLFSITNSLSGTIYSVNDVSGIPSIEVLDTGLVKLAQYGGNVLVGTGTDNNTDKVQINGVLFVNGFKQKQVTVTAASTIALDLNLATNFYITLNQNVTFSFSNLSTSAGASGYIILKQDATGGRTFTLPAEAKKPNAQNPAQYTAANSLSLITYYVVDSSNVILNYIGNFG